MSDYLKHIMHPSWAKQMQEAEPLIKEIDLRLQEERKNERVYFPQGKAIFRAFAQPFDDVKVLIMGQDPYPTPGHAMGLSFSVQPDSSIPRSLTNIFKELNADLDIPTPANGDLTAWTRQGVLLLNRVLTVESGNPDSHKNFGWQAVTEIAIKALAQRQKPLVAILWGKSAQTIKPFLGNTPIIESAHPSPMAAHQGFFGSKPFSRTNIILQELGTTPIDWSL